MFIGRVSVPSARASGRSAQQHGSSAPRIAGTRRGEMQKAQVASTVVRELELEEQLTYAPAYVSVDAAALSKKLEAKSKALIALEEQESATWPKVRVRLQQQIGLGEVWKLVGRVPELGRFSPVVAPTFTWNEGHVWTYEGRVRPGTWLFKVVLRRADNAYIWEEGQDRVIDIPDTAGPDDTFEFVVDNITLESRRW